MSLVGSFSVRVREGSLLTSMYSIPLASLSEKEMVRHKSSLLMSPKTYGSSNSDSDFPAFYEFEGRFFVPRFYGMKMFGVPEKDITNLGSEACLTFCGSLNNMQEEASASCVKALKERGGGMLVLPCGNGKTVVGLHIASRIGVRTLVLVNKSFLVDQWKERIHQFLPESKVGILQRDKVEVECDVVVGMVQSILSREYDMSSFGLVIGDEAHHYAAPSFSKLFNSPTTSLRPNKVLALTATPNRQDGLTPLIHHCMGDVAYQLSDLKSRTKEKVTAHILVFDGGHKEIANKAGQPFLPGMINKLCNDKRRNKVIIDLLESFKVEGRKVIVLSDRVAHLTYLHQNVEGSAMYYGKSTKAEREQGEKEQILLSTFSYAKEGLDIKELDTLILSTPKADVEQSVGRILRPCSTKMDPLIIDLVDPFSLFQYMAHKRKKLYEKLGFEIEH